VDIKIPHNNVLYNSRGIKYLVIMSYNPSHIHEEEPMMEEANVFLLLF
jgi:hypothetical protein